MDVILGHTVFSLVVLFSFNQFQSVELELANQGPRRIDNWGHVFICLCSQTVKQSISRKIIDAEHEYMNMCPYLLIFRGP